MYSGVVGSSSRARRRSETTWVSALSVTVTSRHTRANNSSLVTSLKGRVTRCDSTSSDCGEMARGRSPRSSRNAATSKVNGPKRYRMAQIRGGSAPDPQAQASHERPAKRGPNGATTATGGGHHAVAASHGRPWGVVGGAVIGRHGRSGLPGTPSRSGRRSVRLNARVITARVVDRWDWRGHVDADPAQAGVRVRIGSVSSILPEGRRVPLARVAGRDPHRPPVTRRTASRPAWSWRPEEGIRGAIGRGSRMRSLGSWTAVRGHHDTRGR
jgi:hypothetical protein